MPVYHACVLRQGHVPRQTRERGSVELVICARYGAPTHSETKDAGSRV